MFCFVAVILLLILFCCCNLSRLSLAVYFPKEGFRGESMVLWIHRPIVGDQDSAAAAVAAEAEAATTFVMAGKIFKNATTPI